MKRTATILGIIVLVVILAWPAAANDLKKQIGEAKYDLAVANLVVGLKSGNPGLTKSAAYVLVQIEGNDAVIPLMEVLHKTSDEQSQIAAAWALCKIGDARGVYAVKMAARFEENAKAKSHCAWFYNLYVQNGTFAFSPSVSSDIELTSK